MTIAFLSIHLFVLQYSQLDHPSKLTVFFGVSKIIFDTFVCTLPILLQRHIHIVFFHN